MLHKNVGGWAALDLPLDFIHKIGITLWALRALM